MTKKKKSIYQRVRNPWKKSTEKVHDGGKQQKETKRINNSIKDAMLDSSIGNCSHCGQPKVNFMNGDHGWECAQFNYDPEDYGDVSDWPL